MNESDYVSAYAEQLGEELDNQPVFPRSGLRPVRGNGDPRRPSLAVLYDDSGTLIASYPVTNYRMTADLRGGPVVIDLELRDYS